MKQGPTYLGIFLVAMATLMLEILLTRIVSVQAWYHLAFFIISIGMLGMTAGALIVFLAHRLFPEHQVGPRLAQSSLAFALSVPISLFFVLSARLQPVSDLDTFLSLLGAGAALAIPFIFSGVALTLALTRAGLPPGRSYGIDLCGAAAGCVLVIPLLDRIDAPSAAVASATIAAMAAVAFGAGGRRRGLVIAAALSCAALFALATVNASSRPPPLRPTWVKGAREDASAFSYVRWNTYSRVTVGPSVVGGAFYWGVGEKTPEAVRFRPVEQRQVIIDGLAATAMQRASSDPRDTELLPWDATQFVHHIRPHGPAAVIGVGGGRDVLAAVRAGHEQVLGLELNEAIVAVHRDVMPEYSGLSRMAGVRLVADEARSYLARDTGRYTVITMPMIDTWAATGAGAFSLSENGLYTVEAWKVFLSRLAPRGIFTVSRWYIEDAVGEAVRLTSLAFDSLLRLGIREPRRHVVIVRGGWIATMLVSVTPFDEADLAQMDAHAARLGHVMLLRPGRPAAHPELAAVAEKSSREALEGWAQAQTLDYRAPTDERPFFFNLVRPASWLSGSGVSSHRIAYGGNLQATRTLLFATLASSLMAVLALLVPLALRRRSLGNLRGREVAASLSYFALIGFGFMLVELALLSRLSVFLGHPTLALAVLLAGIIFFSGLGSLASGRLDLERSRWSVLYPLIPAGLLVLLQPLMGPLMQAADTFTIPARVLLSVALIAPPALGMGFGFPIGLRLVRRIEGNPAATGGSIGPWLWGINGACGVTASGLGLACSMAWGVSTTLLAGAACYALLTVAALRLHRAGQSASGQR
jgi:spermidine synthase